MNVLARIGADTLARWQKLRHLLAVVWTVLVVAARPRTWRPAVRNVLARQILFTGFEAVPFIAMIALLVGVTIVVQTQLFSAVGQTRLLGSVLVMVVIRELGPLLTNFVVIGRSGTAIATELANMKINGEVQVLDAQGLDPFIYLVTTRVLGVAVSVFCLTIVFIVAAFGSGFLMGAAAGVAGDPAQFAAGVFRAIQPADVVNVLVKSLLPGMLTGAICATEGLGVGGAVTEVPQAATRGVVRSTGALFIVSALVSVVTYL